VAVYDSQGRIFVKPGDMISKFHMSIYGNYGNSSTWPVFARPPRTSGGSLQIIADYNRINAGETLIYRPVWEKQNPQPGGGGPKPGGPGVGPAPKDPEGILREGKKAALLSCVGNSHGVGPGHSALVVDDYVYTFESVWGAWGVPGTSGWRMVKARVYFAENTHRPIVVQELSLVSTNETSILSYIYESDLDDEDYGSSGHCCYQASQAVASGIGSYPGFNSAIPPTVYAWANRTGCVGSCYTAYPALAADNPAFLAQMTLYYPKANQTWVYPAPAAGWPSA